MTLGYVRILSILVLACSLGACGKKAPQGQVVAVVDGEEVTRRELAVEPDAGALASDGNAQAMAPVLSGVIDRKLAAAEARRLELDRTPRYVALSNRVQEVILSRTLFDRWAAELPRPGSRDIAAYVAGNPQRFEARKMFLVDRIEASAIEGQAAALAPLQTNDAIAAYLKAHSQPYRREQSVLDSSAMPLPFYRQLLAAPLGEPLAIMQDGRLVALAVVQVRDAPTPADKRTEVAVTALRQKAVQQKLAALRQKASIAYQPGYRPSAPEPAAPGAEQPVAMQ